MPRSRSRPANRAAALSSAARLAADDAGLPAELLGDFVDVLAAGRRPSAAELDGYRRHGYAAAQAGAALPAAVDLYLSAAWRAWPDLPAVIAATGAASTSRLRDVGTDVLRASDDAVAALAEGWQEARRQQVRREEARRRDFIDALLSGQGDIAALLEQAEAIGLSLDAPHRVLVAGGDVALDDAGPAASDVESVLRVRSRGDSYLLASKEGYLAAVVAGRLGRDVAAELVVPLERHHRGHSFRAAVSRIRSGVQAVSRSWRDGCEALMLAERLKVPDAVIETDDLMAYALLLRDRRSASDLVRTTLGPLVRARGGAGPLVETLLAVYAAGGNTTSAARALHLSVRAVHYRLDRVATLTGYRYDDSARRFTLEAAAVAARLLDWPRQPLAGDPEPRHRAPAATPSPSP